MLTSPLLIAAISAVFALLGTGVGAALQGYWNTRLERQKFESGLIEKALNTDKKELAAANLQFLVNAGLLLTVDPEKIQQLAQHPDQLPIRTSGPMPPSETALTVRNAKLALQALRLYKGVLDSQETPDFTAALKEFQTQQKITDEIGLGPRTKAALAPRVPEVPASSLHSGIGGPR